MLLLKKREDTCQPETSRRDTRHTNKHRHGAQPEDGKQPQTSPEHAGNRTPEREERKKVYHPLETDGVLVRTTYLVNMV